MKASRQERADLLNRIVAAQRRAGLTYADIANGSGVDPSQVSRICRGHFTTLGGAVMKICMFLEVQPDPASGPSAPSGSDGPADPGWSQLSRAVRNAWDRTPEGAARLAKVIAAVAEVAKR